MFDDTFTEEGSLPFSSSEEKETPKDSSPNDSEVEKTQDEESEAEDKTIPYNRFQKVVHERNDWKQKAEERERLLKDEIESLKETSFKQQTQWTPQTWEEVLDVAKQRVVEQLESQEKTKERSLDEADKYIQTELDTLRELGETFEENDLLQFMVDNGLENIQKGYQLFKKVGQAHSEGKEEGKRVASRKAKSTTGSSAKASEGIGEPKRPYLKWSRASLDDVVEEAMQKIGIKK